MENKRKWRNFSTDEKKVVLICFGNQGRVSQDMPGVPGLRYTLSPMEKTVRTVRNQIL
jgi:hypothetical protein